MMRSALVFSPPLALVGAAGWLTLNRAKLPERWPIHWGVDGQPDGWAGPSTAYIPLGVGLLAWATLEVLARVLERCTYPNMDEKSSDICGKARADLLRCISLAVCLILAAVGGILPFHTESTASPYFLSLIHISEPTRPY